jgi:hypothetical protein
MSKFRNLAKKALKEKVSLTENILYKDGITERMDSSLEQRIREGKHSLAGCNVMPEGDIISTEEKLIRERFNEVVMAVREAYDMDVVDNMEIMKQQAPLVTDAMAMEEAHKKELEQLAVEMVMEEFGIEEGDFIFEAELRPDIDRKSTQETPQETITEFEDHEEITNANKEVLKRRVLNAMIQGAAKSVNHMFHLKHDDLVGMNPRLPGTYKKLMTGADYMYFILDKMQNGQNGGKCECEHQENENGEVKPVIKAQAMVFPVLVHELVKGVMDVLSSHGLPQQDNITEYVLSKADYLNAEPDDMRFGTPMWRKFCNAVPADDFDLKHHAFAKLAALPVSEFNEAMKNIIAETKTGKRIVKEMIDETKKEIQEYDYNESLNNDDGLFEIGDLLG